MTTLKSQWQKVSGISGASGHHVDLFYSKASEHFKVRVSAQTDDRQDQLVFPSGSYRHMPDGMPTAQGLNENDQARLRNAIAILIGKLAP